VQVHAVNCAAERCTVRLRVTSKLLVQPFVGQQSTPSSTKNGFAKTASGGFFRPLSAPVPRAGTQGKRCQGTSKNRRFQQRAD
jgi:hypothetical protein